ncbi:hypothetical protein EUTSA_v10019793mg [Eutrema salsugineum]|uniref:Bifunctional inhibitor/plant lipid transfer protein/seed storage helical domain-containing protein n=1 Tax=Eutrema salsugineum TaxID=72664 RepID=V4JRD7_EUTSA|nr:hypothetical protein EUTSA_v10019793mg [Eutrema salsugineum]
MDTTRFLGVGTVLVILYSVQATAQIGEAEDTMRCVQKLMPCRPYIHSEIPPPPWCCDPMKEIAEKDTTCLCAVFNHPGMLSYINLSKENALSLLESCGANHDVSICTNTAWSSSASTTKYAALTISFLGFSFISAFTGF